MRPSNNLEVDGPRAFLTNKKMGDEKWQLRS